MRQGYLDTDFFSLVKIDKKYYVNTYNFGVYRIHRLLYNGSTHLWLVVLSAKFLFAHIIMLFIDFVVYWCNTYIEWIPITIAKNDLPWNFLMSTWFELGLLLTTDYKNLFIGLKKN